MKNSPEKIQIIDKNEIRKGDYYKKIAADREIGIVRFYDDDYMSLAKSEPKVNEFLSELVANKKSIQILSNDGTCFYDDLNFNVLINHAKNLDDAAFLIFWEAIKAVKLPINSLSIADLDTLALSKLTAFCSFLENLSQCVDVPIREFKIAGTFNSHTQNAIKNLKLKHGLANMLTIEVSTNIIHQPLLELIKPFSLKIWNTNLQDILNQLVETLPLDSIRTFHTCGPRTHNVEELEALKKFLDKQALIDNLIFSWDYQSSPFSWETPEFKKKIVKTAISRQGATIEIIDETIKAASYMAASKKVLELFKNSKKITELSFENQTYPYAHDVIFNNTRLTKLSLKKSLTSIPDEIREVFFDKLKKMTPLIELDLSANQLNRVGFFDTFLSVLRYLVINGKLEKLNIIDNNFSSEQKKKIHEVFIKHPKFMEVETGDAELNEKIKYSNFISFGYNLSGEFNRISKLPVFERNLMENEKFEELVAWIKRMPKKAVLPIRVSSAVFLKMKEENFNELYKLCESNRIKLEWDIKKLRLYEQYFGKEFSENHAKRIEGILSLMGCTSIDIGNNQLTQLDEKQLYCFQKLFKKYALYSITDQQLNLDGASPEEFKRVCEFLRHLIDNKAIQNIKINFENEKLSPEKKIFLLHSCAGLLVYRDEEKKKDIAIIKNTHTMLPVRTLSKELVQEILTYLTGDPLLIGKSMFLVDDTKRDDLKKYVGTAVLCKKPLFIMQNKSLCFSFPATLEKRLSLLRKFLNSQENLGDVKELRGLLNDTTKTSEAKEVEAIKLIQELFSKYQNDTMQNEIIFSNNVNAFSVFYPQYKKAETEKYEQTKKEIDAGQRLLAFSQNYLQK